MPCFIHKSFLICALSKIEVDNNILSLILKGRYRAVEQLLLSLERALTSPLNRKNWLDKWLKGRLQHKEGSGAVLSPVIGLSQASPGTSSTAGLTEMQLKAFLGDIYQTQWLNLLYLKAEMQHFSCTLRLSPFLLLPTPEWSSTWQHVIFPVSKHCHAEIWGGNACSQHTSGHLAKPTLGAAWDDQDPSPPREAGAPELLPDGVSPRAQQLLALFSCQNPSLGNAGGRCPSERQELLAARGSCCWQSCRLPLSEPFSLHPDFARSPVKGGTAFPVPTEPWTWPKGPTWSTLNASPISVHGFLFLPVRPHIYSLMLLKTYLLYNPFWTSCLWSKILICHFLHQTSKPPL